MTKKDYELIARIFNKNINDTDPRTIKANAPTVARAMAQQFADVFAQQNPRFNTARFLEACGVGE